MYRDYCETFDGDRGRSDGCKDGRYSDGDNTEQEERDMRLNETVNSGNPGDLVTFFNGIQVSNTMDKIRQSIYHIRQNWYTKRDNFNELLNEFLIKELSNDHPDLLQTWQQHLKSNIDWCDVKDGVEEVGHEDHWVIRLYTSQKSYNYVFKSIYEILRAQDNPNYEEVLTAVYLIELMNIDLYNYAMREPLARNFDRMVYRGMVLERHHVQKYKDLLGKPISDRYISIPLALNSTSTNKTISENFIIRQVKASKDDKVAAFMRIYVIGLAPAFIAHYRERFPQSKISTISAVDISSLSVYPQESEVLLRGAFLQVLDVYGSVSNGMGIVTVECAMLNTNRDHLSNGILDPDVDTEARQLFALMVKRTRFDFCRNYCYERDMTEDAELYEQEYEQADTALRKMMEN